MFKCDSCGEVFDTRECFSLATQDSDDEFMVFDGDRLCDVCPLCGGLISQTESVLVDKVA